MRLTDIKIPNFKFPKIKMRGIENIPEVNIDYDKINKEGEIKKDKKQYKPTEYKTIKEIFERSTEVYENKEFILEKFNSKGEFEQITYKQFGDDVIALGTALTNKYNLKDERIIIVSETTYQWYISYMAALCGAGIAVPTDKELPANELENVIKRSKATIVIYSERMKESIKKIENNLPGVKYFAKMYSDDKLVGRNIGLNTIIREGRELVSSGDDSFMKIKIDPEEFKVLIFTSGTTSQSKGVMLCNRNLTSNVNAVSAAVKLYPTDRLFSVLPLHHTYESTIGFLVPMACGCSIAVCQGLKYIVPNLKETKPTAMLAVPLLVENLYKKINASIEKGGKTGLVNSMIHVTNALKTVGIDIKKKVFNEIYENLGGNLRFIVSAAAPIDAKVGKWVQDIGITFLQGYGLTETAPIAALTPEYDTRVGSAGKPVICAEIRIHNPNENGEGEVWIKSKTLMLGYYENEEATKEVMHDGWFNAGDIGYLDDEGFLYITGRSKNVIVTQNGKNIYPEEIELMLGKVEEIKECMVYGKQLKEGDKELTITARVIPDYEKIEEKHGKDLSEEKIYDIIWNEIKQVNRKLTSYKAIKRLEIKKDEFEKTTTMKIKRFAELKKDN